MEAIDMLECRFDLFPAKFRRDGHIYEIEAVTECKTLTAPSGRSEAYHFWVRCEGKILHLYRSLSSGQWVLAA